MAFPTVVTDQIPDCGAGDAPAAALGNFYIAVSQALSNAAHNATNSQQQSGIDSQAATIAGVATLLTLDTAATGARENKMFPTEAAAVSMSNVAAASSSAASDDVPTDIVALQLAFAASLAMLNVVQHQQQMYIVLQAAQTMALAKLIPNDPVAALEQISQASASTEHTTIETLKELAALAGDRNGSAGL